jgi:hypothetical protein
MGADALFATVSTHPRALLPAGCGSLVENARPATLEVSRKPSRGCTLIARGEPTGVAGQISAAGAGWCGGAAVRQRAHHPDRPTRRAPAPRNHGDRQKYQRDRAQHAEQEDRAEHGEQPDRATQQVAVDRGRRERGAGGCPHHLLVMRTRDTSGSPRRPTVGESRPPPLPHSRPPAASLVLQSDVMTSAPQPPAIQGRLQGNFGMPQPSEPALTSAFDRPHRRLRTIAWRRFRSSGGGEAGDRSAAKASASRGGSGRVLSDGTARVGSSPRGSLGSVGYGDHHVGQRQ